LLFLAEGPLLHCFWMLRGTVRHRRGMSIPMLAVKWAIRPQCLYPAARGKIRAWGAIVAHCDSYPVTVLRGPSGSINRGDSESRSSGFKSNHGLHYLKMEGVSKSKALDRKQAVFKTAPEKLQPIRARLAFRAPRRKRVQDATMRTFSVYYGHTDCRLQTFDFTQLFKFLSGQ